VLILFNSPEYQEISLANWLGEKPSSLLSANFGIAQDVIDKLPKKERGIIRKGNQRRTPPRSIHTIAAEPDGRK